MAKAAEERECPFCKESIRADAVKCRYCGSRIVPREAADEGVCPFCREEIKPGAIKCRHCHSRLGAAAAIPRGGMARRPMRGDCGCGYGPRGATLARESPADEWWACVDYCFLLTLGGDDFDQCVQYRCGDYPIRPDVEV